MFPQEIIRKKRNGETLAPDEIRFFVNGLTDGSISSEQVSALAMAVYFQSMNFAETGELTRAMVASGCVIDWTEEGIEKRVVDKHSTGGVGDKVSLILAPLVAACGAYVPMISGRGLGHTGGTLDKLDSVPGYDTSPGLDVFKKVVGSAGCAIIGQTAELAPADRRFYSIRDITATVESIPLITASILSKKVSAGLRGLSMDIKTGTGAFMETEAAAEALGQSIVNTAAEIGLPVKAVVTDMSEALGRNAGNAVEIRETIDYLTGVYRDGRLHEVVFTLAADMLELAGIEKDRRQARKLLQSVLDQGEAARVFVEMISALGGPVDLVERVDHYLPLAPVIKPVFLREEGYVSNIDVRRVGNTVVALGGGRKRVDDDIDYRVGLTDIAGIGAGIDARAPIARVHARTEADAEAAIESLQRAFRLATDKPLSKPVIRKTLSAIRPC